MGTKAAQRNAETKSKKTRSPNFSRKHARESFKRSTPEASKPTTTSGKSDAKKADSGSNLEAATKSRTESESLTRKAEVSIIADVEEWAKGKTAHELVQDLNEWGGCLWDAHTQQKLR